MSIIHKQVEVERSKPAVFNFMRFYMIADIGLYDDWIALSRTPKS